MARIEMNDSITTYMLDLERAATNTPQLCKRMLDAEAAVVESALRAELTTMGLVDTGKLRSSIGRRFTWRNTSIMIVGPSGDHHSHVSRSGSAGTLRSGHLGYIHEYGAPQRGIRPKFWMRSTISKVRGKALDAAEAAHDKYLKDNNL